jgi:hypothetical protein
MHFFFMVASTIYENSMLDMGRSDTAAPTNGGGQFSHPRLSITARRHHCFSPSTSG